MSSPRFIGVGLLVLVLMGTEHTAFAAGILVNWLEYIDTEHKAIAEFDGTLYTPVLPGELYESYQKHLMKQRWDFGEFIKKEFLPVINSAPDRPEIRKTSRC